MRSIISGILLFSVLWILTGVVYPLAVTAIAKVAFTHQSTGSLVRNNERVIGSRFIGQTFKEDKYFWSRPSAHNYDALKSGGTNWAPTSKELLRVATERRERLAIAHKSDLKSVPPNLIYASGSGLDPHITVEAAYYQMERIVQARNMEHGEGPKLIKEIVEQTIQQRVARYLGNPRVNVLLLNRKLDELTKK